MRSSAINKIGINKIDKMPLSFVHPKETINLSAKVTGETKSRYQALIKAGYTAEDLIRVACEVHEYMIDEKQRELNSGNTKRKLQLMQKS